MKLTRRQLATVLAPAAALAQSAGPAAAPPSPDEELRVARERFKSNAQALAQQKVPMATEPAFQFKA